MNRIALAVLILAGLGLVSVVSCGRAAPEPSEDPLVLRAYSVPAGLENHVAVTLNQALQLGEDRRLGRAQTAPDGTLLVAVPQSYHPGIEEFLAQLEAKGVGSAPPTTIQFDLWVVLGKKSATPPALEGLGALRPALEAIVDSQGNQEFLVVETLGGSLLSGQRARLRGAFTNLGINARDLGDALRLDLRIDQVFKTELETTLQAREGEIVVVGQATAPIYTNDDRFAPWAYGSVSDTGRYPGVEDHPAVYYVVRATRSR